MRGERRTERRERRPCEAGGAGCRVQRDQPRPPRTEARVSTRSSRCSSRSSGAAPRARSGTSRGGRRSRSRGARRRRRNATCGPPREESGARPTPSPRSTRARTHRWCAPPHGATAKAETGWVLDGEKWHVTSGDVADFFLVHAHVDGDPAKPTVFLVDKDLRGCAWCGRRSTPTRSCSNIRSSRSTASGCPRTPCSATWARDTSSRRTGSSKSG